MSIDTIIVMLLSILIVWGGFIFLLITAMSKKSGKSKNG